MGGKRAFNGFKDRTLPHYPRGDKTPAGEGRGRDRDRGGSVEVESVGI